MELDPTDVLELVFTSSKRALEENHAKLVAATPEFEKLVAGHSLTLSRRLELILALEEWDEERLWFTVDERGGISLEDVCGAAGTEVEIVRAHYRTFLHVSFNIKKAFSALMWENALVGDKCGRCPSGRCEVPQARVHDEGGALRQGLAGPDSLCAEGPDSVH